MEHTVTLPRKELEELEKKAKVYDNMMRVKYDPPQEHHRSPHATLELDLNEVSQDWISAQVEIRKISLISEGFITTFNSTTRKRIEGNDETRPLSEIIEEQRSFPFSTKL